MDSINNEGQPLVRPTQSHNLDVSCSPLAHGQTGASSSSLCTMCARTIDLDQTLKTDSYFRHHATYDDLVASGRKGCLMCSAVLNVHQNRAKYGLYPCNLEQYIGNETTQITCRFADLDYEKSEAKLTWAIDGGDIIGLLSTYTEGDDPIAEDFLTRPISTEIPSDSMFEMIKMWMGQCLSEHGKCYESPNMALPRRLLDVSTPGKLRLIEGEGILGNWVALSHCWGTGDQPKKTTKANLRQHLHSIDLDDLPATFQDAVLITQRLSYQYLWIDSLCIIQDSENDWSIESSKMNYIYQKAILTIAAEAASHSREGIFASSTSTRKENVVHPFSVQATSQKGKRVGQIHFRDPLPGAIQESGPLSSRAWVLQEQLLSPRILSFGSQQIHWHCRTLDCPERNPFGTSPMNRWAGMDKFDRAFIVSRHDYRTPPQWFQWYRIVEEYMFRKITFDTDRLPAISALASQFTRMFPNLEYYAGLWKQDFHAHLLWRVQHPNMIRSQSYVAPSWSWASLRGPIPTRSGLYPPWQKLDETKVALHFKVNNFYAQNVGNVYGKITHGAYVEVTGGTATICRHQVSATCFDHFVGEFDWLSLLDPFKDILEFDDQAHEHAELHLLHVADGPGTHGELAEEQFLAWCLLLQPREGNEEDNDCFERVGLVRIPWGRDFGLDWVVKTLKLF